MKKIICFVCLFFLLSGFVFAEEPLFISGVRTLGMGGAFVSVSDDQNAFFYNPAGFALRKDFLLTLGELNVSINQDIVEGGKFIVENYEDLAEFDTLPEERQAELMTEIIDEVSKYKMKLNLGIPNFNFAPPAIPLFGLGHLGIGVGLFDNIGVNLRLNSGLIIPTVDLKVRADAVGMVPIAYSFGLPVGELSLGVNAKYLYRGGVEEVRKSILEFEEYNPQLNVGSGMGFDVGAIYRLLDLPVVGNLNIGAVIRDAGGTEIVYNQRLDTETGEIISIDNPATKTIKQQIDLGVSTKLFNFLTVAIDARDILRAGNLSEVDESFFKQLHAGAEADLKVIKLRAGLNQGYPTFGVGLSLFFVHIDYAYWTEELGVVPGQQPEHNHLVSIALRF